MTNKILSVITTNDRKEKYTDSSLSYFNMGAVHFVENMVCANAYEDANERLKKVKDEFKKQLLQFQKNVLLPANSWEIVSMIIKLLICTQTNIFKTGKSCIHWKTEGVS